MLPTLWDDIKYIRCINLTERPDRKRTSSQMFQSLQIPAVYYETQRDPKGGERGCYESHRMVMKDCVENYPECPYALIFEDDADVLNVPSEQSIEEVRRFLKTQTNWHILFLGASPNLVVEKTRPLKDFTFIRQVH